MVEMVGHKIEVIVGKHRGQRGTVTGVGTAKTPSGGDVGFLIVEFPKSGRRYFYPSEVVVTDEVAREPGTVE